MFILFSLTSLSSGEKPCSDCAVADVEADSKILPAICCASMYIVSHVKETESQTEAKFNLKKLKNEALLLVVACMVPLLLKKHTYRFKPTRPPIVSWLKFMNAIFFSYHTV